MVLLDNTKKNFPPFWKAGLELLKFWSICLKKRGGGRDHGKKNSLVSSPLSESKPTSFTPHHIVLRQWCLQRQREQAALEMLTGQTHDWRQTCGCDLLRSRLIRKCRMCCSNKVWNVYNRILNKDKTSKLSSILKLHYSVMHGTTGKIQTAHAMSVWSTFYSCASVEVGIPATL